MGDLVDFRRTGNGYSKSVFTGNKYYIPVFSDSIEFQCHPTDGFLEGIPAGPDPETKLTTVHYFLEHVLEQK